MSNRFIASVGLSLKKQPIEFALLVLLVITLARHVVLAAFVHPYGDDLSYAVMGMDTGFFEGMANEYTRWSGRYFSAILVLRGPLALGLGAGLIIYRLVAVVLIMLTLIGAFTLARRIFPDEPVRTSLVAAMLFTMLYLHLMPDASEGFYWYTGSVTYQFPNALSLFLVANWIGYFNEGKRKTSPFFIIIQSLLAFIIAGCNEVHMAFMLVGHAGMLWHGYHSARRIDRVLLFLLVVSAVSALLVINAPGNAFRSANFPHRHEMLRTIGYASAQTGRFMGEWLFSPLIVLTILIPSWSRRLAERSARALRFLSMDKWVCLALLLFIVWLPMMMPYWATGMLGQHRTPNVACFYFLPMWFVTVAVWDHQVFRGMTPLPRPSLARMILILTILLFLFTGRDKALNNDLFSGRVVRYNKQMHERYWILTEAVRTGAEEVTIPPIVDMPTSLTILRLQASPEHWMNRSTANYFGNNDLDIRVEATP